MNEQKQIKMMIKHLETGASELIQAKFYSGRFTNWSQMILLNNYLKGVERMLGSFIDEFKNEDE